MRQAAKFRQQFDFAAQPIAGRAEQYSIAGLLQPGRSSRSGARDMDANNEKETRQRALAAEDALLILIDRLAMRGVISVDEGIDVLQVLSRGCDQSAARVSQSLNLLSQLRRLRQGNGSIAPGAPATGPLLG
jgi:hypothetical protein